MEEHDKWNIGKLKEIMGGNLIIYEKQRERERQAMQGNVTQDIMNCKCMQKNMS